MKATAGIGMVILAIVCKSDFLIKLAARIDTYGI